MLVACAWLAKSRFLPIKGMFFYVSPRLVFLQKFGLMIVISVKKGGTTLSGKYLLNIKINKLS